MAFMSSGVEYALHCLLHLVNENDGVAEASIRSLAEFQGVSREYLSKIFTKLHKAGLVSGIEGVGGGFKLARSAHDISVLNVVEAIDGKKNIFQCKEVRKNCILFEKNAPPQWAIEGLCTIHAVMLEAEEKMRQNLSRHTLYSLSSSVSEKSPSAYKTKMQAFFSQPFSS